MPRETASLNLELPHLPSATLNKPSVPASSPLVPVPQEHLLISLEGLSFFLELSNFSVLGPAAPMHQTTSPNPDPDTASRNLLWAKDVSQLRLCKQLQLSLATLKPSHSPGPRGQRIPL